MPPLLLFEDEHLLVINKPAGMNTHSPSPYSGEGVYEWLKHREPRWANLGIQHRLDKETSGVLVFGKTTLANRSLTQQFTERRVQKIYLLLTDRPAPPQDLIVKSKLARAGDRYASSSVGESAETRFRPGNHKTRIERRCHQLIAEPVTGRTHQIRVHAAERGFPILGDSLYGGSPFHRVCLHAAELRLHHPADDRELVFSAPVDFTLDTHMLLRDAFIDPTQTDAYRRIHGMSDGWPGWYVDQLGGNLLSQSAAPLTDAQRDRLESLAGTRATGLYHKILDRQVRRSAGADASPRWISGPPAPERFPIRENGISFELSFAEGYSTGLFLDQRDNRRRLLTGHVGARFSMGDGNGLRGLHLLNAFAYTCGFSVCAAQAGAITTSLDLSRKYLDWGRRNFELNQADAARHDFIYGDALNWFRRLAKKERRFNIIVLDPPTFSQSKESGVFRVEKDLRSLVSAAMPLLKHEGILFVSTNAADWTPEHFLAHVLDAVADSKRKVTQNLYVPQPPDFPVSRQEPAYLKTVWLRID